VKMENVLFMKNTTKQSTLNCSSNILENLLEINLSSMEPNKELEQAIEDKFLTPSKFSLEIEKIVAEENMNYIDAICYYCEINKIEVDSITKLVSKPLKERLKYDAINLNFMKKTSKARLPLWVHLSAINIISLLKVILQIQNTISLNMVGSHGQP